MSCGREEQQNFLAGYAMKPQPHVTTTQCLTMVSRTSVVLQISIWGNSVCLSSLRSWEANVVY